MRAFFAIDGDDGRDSMDDQRGQALELDDSDAQVAGTIDLTMAQTIGWMRCRFCSRRDRADPAKD